MNESPTAKPSRFDIMVLVAALTLLAVISFYQHRGIKANINFSSSDYDGYYQLGIDVAYGRAPAISLPPHFMPGVYLFYGGILRLSQLNYSILIAVNTMLYGLTSIVTYLICLNLKPLFTIRLWPTLLLCLHTSKINYLKFVATETPCAALVACFVLGMVLYLKYHRLRLLVISAICLGGAVLFRPAALSIGIGVSLYFFWQWRRTQVSHYFKIPIILILVICVMILPNLWKNYLHLEEFVPFTTSGGSGFLCGNNPLSDGTWCGGNFYPYLKQQAIQDNVPVATWGNDTRWDRYNYLLGFRFIRTHPRQASILLLKKSLYFWAEGLARNIPWWKKSFHLIKIFLIVFGIIALIRQRTPPTILLAVTLLGFYFFHIIYLTQTRYKVPVDWLINIMLVYGIGNTYRAALSWNRNHRRQAPHTNI